MCKQTVFERDCQRRGLEGEKQHRVSGQDRGRICSSSFCLMKKRQSVKYRSAESNQWRRFHLLRTSVYLNTVFNHTDKVQWHNPWYIQFVLKLCYPDNFPSVLKYWALFNLNIKLFFLNNPPSSGKRRPNSTFFVS